MMKRKFDLIIEDCLSRMDRGDSLTEILAAYPKLVDKIEPLMLVAMLGRALPHPVPGYTALRLGKNDLLAEMASMQSEGAFREPKPAAPPRETLVDRLAGSLKQLQPAYRLAMLSLVVIMAGGFFTLSASASGLADNILNTLFFSFEQVGDMLMVRPSPPKSLVENPIFSSDYGLPQADKDHPEDFKGLMVEDDQINPNDPGRLGNEYQDRIQARQYTMTVLPDEEGDLFEVDDEKDLEKEEKKEEKDLVKEEKEEEKDIAKAEKDAEKDEKKAVKDAEKDEKDTEKALIKEIKDAEKDEKKAIKDAEKDKKKEDKNKNKNKD